MMETLVLIIHVFSAIIGAGGAFASDGMFFSAVKDGKINRDEMRFLHLGSSMVWVGLIVLFISGILLFSFDPERYLASSKFLAKVSIVAIIATNGFFFHLFHLPRIRDHVGVRFVDSSLFLRAAPFILVSGAISAVSWTTTVILGVVDSLPYSYAALMGAYFAATFSAICAALFLKKKILIR